MKYKGEITLMFEQGCGQWPQFHDYRGRHGDNKQFWNWDWTINFGKHTKIKKLKIWNDDNKLVYNDKWTCDRQASCKYYIPSPKEMNVDVWLGIFMENSDKLKCEVITDEILDALKKEE